MKLVHKIYSLIIKIMQDIITIVTFISLLIS